VSTFASALINSNEHAYIGTCTLHRVPSKHWVLVLDLRVSCYARDSGHYSRLFSGLGSVVSPLVCQTIIATGVPWYRFYYGSLLLSAMNLLFLGITFRPTPDELILERRKNLACATLQSTAYSLGFDSLDTDRVMVQAAKQRSEVLGHGSK